jgi:diguanylate cyclase (GGDEF)-like protein
MWLFPLSVMFTATVHRPRLVVLSGATGLIGYVLVAASDGGTIFSGMVVRACYMVALTYSAGTTAHFRWRDHDAQVELTRRLSALADHDGLTGLFNHRALHENLAREYADAERHGAPLAVLLLDIDHFKAVNDEHGHLIGDAVLKAVADAIVPAVRPRDIVARIGGEEFCILLPRTDVHEAQVVAERVRLAIAEITVPVAVTASIGVSMSTGHHTADGRCGPVPSLNPATGLLERADQALYDAKRHGRNSIRAERMLALDTAGA